MGDKSFGFDNDVIAQYAQDIKSITELGVQLAVVIGGGNITKLKALPSGCQAGQNANAFSGGFRLWGRDDRIQSDRHAGRLRRERLINYDRGIQQLQIEG